MRQAAMAVLLATAIGCGTRNAPPAGGEPAANVEKKTAAGTYRAGETIALGPHVRVTFDRAAVTSLSGTEFNRTVQGDVLRIDYTLENVSPVKVVDWPGWQGEGRVKDEHDNTFKDFTPARHFLFSTTEEADAYDASTRLDPKTKRVRHLYFQKMPPSSKKAFLELRGPAAIDPARFRVELRVRHGSSTLEPEGPARPSRDDVRALIGKDLARVRDALGVPARVGMEGEQQVWRYEKLTAERDLLTTLRFDARGRLLSVDFD